MLIWIYCFEKGFKFISFLFITKLSSSLASGLRIAKLSHKARHFRLQKN
jgi:hypothetical protein